jgi:hypothetical protein
MIVMHDDISPPGKPSSGMIKKRPPARLSFWLVLFGVQRYRFIFGEVGGQCVAAD